MSLTRAELTVSLCRTIRPATRRMRLIKDPLTRELRLVTGLNKRFTNRLSVESPVDKVMLVLR